MDMPLTTSNTRMQFNFIAKFILMLGIKSVLVTY